MCFSLASVVHLVIVVALKLWSGRRYGCRRLVLSPGVAWRRTLLDRCRKDNSCAYVVFNALSITALAMRCRRCRRFHHHFHYVGKHCRFQGCTGVLTRRVFIRRAVGATVAVLSCAVGATVAPKHADPLSWRRRRQRRQNAGLLQYQEMLGV